MIDASARDAWSRLDAQLRPFIARRVRSPADVDDVVQNVFLRMQRGLVGLRDEERFGPWVYRIARNAVADHFRDVARRHSADAHPDELPVEDADDNRAEEEVSSYVTSMVALLSSPYREALTLTELEGKSQREAADVMGISLSGMKSRVQRGRAQLRATLEACCRIGLDARGRVLSCEARPDGPLSGCRCR